MVFSYIIYSSVRRKQKVRFLAKGSVPFLMGSKILPLQQNAFDEHGNGAIGGIDELHKILRAIG